jgi:hypothetical protein
MSYRISSNGNTQLIIGVPESKFSETCVLIDKLDKVELSALQEDFNKLGLDLKTIENILQYMKVSIYHLIHIY